MRPSVTVSSQLTALPSRSFEIANTILQLRLLESQASEPDEVDAFGRRMYLTSKRKIRSSGYAITRNGGILKVLKSAIVGFMNKLRNRTRSRHRSPRLRSIAHLKLVGYRHSGHMRPRISPAIAAACRSSLMSRMIPSGSSTCQVLHAR